MGVYARAIVSAPKHADEFRKAIRNIADYGYRDGETMPCTNCGDTMRGYDDSSYYCSSCFPRRQDHGGEDIGLEYD